MDKKKECHRYYLGKNILIGCKGENTFFWIKDDKEYWNPDKGKLNVLKSGKAWIDKQSDTTILDFPTSDRNEMRNSIKLFIQSSDTISRYAETDFYVQLADCIPNKPMMLNFSSSDYSDLIDHDYEIPEHQEGYVLNDNTFLRNNTKTGELYYVKFSSFTDIDFEVDRFGWVKAAREFFSFESDDDLISELKYYQKESYGKAWIDKKNDVLVLGPVDSQEIEIKDNYFDERLCSYLCLYSEWNQTNRWIDIESGITSNPFNWKVNYYYLLEKYMG